MSDWSFKHFAKKNTSSSKEQITRTPATSMIFACMVGKSRESPRFCILFIMLDGDFKRLFILSIGLRSCCNENSSFRISNLLSSAFSAQRYLKEHQKDFMPEDTKAGMIQAFLDSYAGDTVCSKQLYKEALNHAFDEPKQWEIREINEIMNQCVSGWTYFSNPRSFAGYGRQKGWEREKAATGSGNLAAEIPDRFVEITEQIEMPF